MTSSGGGPIKVEVTQSEIDRYWEFVRSEVQKTGRQLPSPILWHYTSGEGLVGIIQSGTFWLTHISCVNDSTELRHAGSLLRGAFEKKQLEAMQTLVTTHVPELLLYDRVITALSTDASPTSEWFIGCLSEDGDDLSQWRAYGGGEGGYAVGFDVQLLHLALIQQNALWVSVCYDTVLQYQIAQSVADATVQFYLEGLAARPGIQPTAWVETFLPAWRDRIAYIGPITKHPAFAAEREWRIIRGLRGDADWESLKFQQRQSMLRRHLPLALPTLQLGDLLPICAVRVGPSRHKEISRVSVADLLQSKGYPEQVSKHVLVSEVPFQAI